MTDLTCSEDVGNDGNNVREDLLATSLRNSSIASDAGVVQRVSRCRPGARGRAGGLRSPRGASRVQGRKRL